MNASHKNLHWRAILGGVALLAMAPACGDNIESNPPVDARRVADAPPTLPDAFAGPTRVAPYINRDTGLATENPDVEMSSGCATPDTMDTQVLSLVGTTTNNVHVDACLFGVTGNAKLDGQATFESSGVGFISACPDPDAITDGANGPKTAMNTDTNGDTFNDRCVQSGFQEKAGAAGDNEFHARFNNSLTAGTQTVVFCLDANGDGCADETVKNTVTITWTN